MAARVDGIAPVEGGASNLTFRVALRAAPYGAIALRLQRATGIFQPYDVVREGRVLQALAATDIPAPRVLLIAPDGAALGAPFVILEWIDAPHMGIAGREADYGAYVRTVAAIHRVDWARPGFDVLPIPPDAATATAGEIEAVANRITAFGVDDPLLTHAHQRLLSNVPGDGGLSLCQGDINVFNYLFRNREVVGVVDWEQARIGDRRSDVAQLVVLAHLKGAPFGPVHSQGFVQAYEAASGQLLSGLEFFRAFWAWQLTFIHHAWLKSNGTEPWYTREAVGELLERSLAEVG
jgi:aminoglycoside phosphotransferase (APT) family kinase protein